jgi:hypothetical protein
MYTISRNHKGITANAVAGKELQRNVYETFSYALNCYGFLIHENETIQPIEWINRIQTYYNNNSRLNEVIRCIKIAFKINI